MLGFCVCPGSPTDWPPTDQPTTQLASRQKCLGGVEKIFTSLISFQHYMTLGDKHHASTALTLYC
jgi:hypothetical protein